MTQIKGFNKEAWLDWLEEHLPVKEMASKYPPHILYRLTTTNQTGTGRQELPSMARI